MAREWEPNYRERITMWVWERLEAAHPGEWLRRVGPVWNPKRERERRRRPHLWPRMTQTARLWADYLQGVEQEEVGRAVAAFDLRGVPTLREFMAACGPGRRRPQPEPQPETPEQYRARRARGAQGLAQARSLLADEQPTSET